MSRNRNKGKRPPGNRRNARQSAKVVENNFKLLSELSKESHTNDQP